MTLKRRKSGFCTLPLRAAHVAARSFSYVARFANAIGTLVVLFLVLAIDADVIGRGVFNAPINGTYEIVQFSMVLIVFLQLPDVIRSNKLTRSDGFLGVLAIRKPWIAKCLARAIDLTSCVFMVLVAYALWPVFLEMWESQDYFGIPGVFTAPVWPLKLTICFSAVLAALIFLSKAVAGRRRPDLPPS